MSWGVSTSVAKWGETRLIKRSEELRLSPSRLFERCKYKQFAGTVQIFEEKKLIYDCFLLPFHCLSRLDGIIAVISKCSPIAVQVQNEVFGLLQLSRGDCQIEVLVDPACVVRFEC